MYLIYNDNPERKISIKTFQHDNTRIVVIGAEKMTENTSGFRIYMNEEDATDYLDFSSYTTKYNVLSEIENGIIYTADGSVEKEGENFTCPVSIGTAEDTERIKILALESMKKAKILESKQMLDEYLQSHPLYSTVHNSEGAYYNVTQDKRNIMMSNYMHYQIELVANPDAVLTWNETGKSCEVWTQEEFMQLILEIGAYVKPKVSAQQHYEEMVTMATSKEEIDAIVLSYEDSGETEAEE